MDNIQVFNNPEFGDVRTIIINGEPWFVAKDIAEKLGYAKTFSMTKQIDDEDKQTFDCSSQEDANFSSKARQIGIINESGLYSAIMGSQLKSAKLFKRWVTKDILPSIRKTGGYGNPQLPDDPMKLLKLHYEALEQVDKKVNKVESRVNDIQTEVKALKDDMPVFQADAKDIQADLRKKAVKELGGYKSNAYNDRSVRGCVFADIQRELKRQFDVKRYDQIKHKDTSAALQVIAKYELPLALKSRVDMANAQQTLKLERKIIS